MVRALLTCALAPATSVSAGDGAAVPSSGPATGMVTYVTSEMIYLDVGSQQGLTKGAPLEVRRDGVSLAALSVTSLSSRRAACTVPVGHQFQVNDQVIFDGVAGNPADAMRARSDESRAPSPPASDGSWRGVSAPGDWQGRVGLRFFARSDGSGRGDDTYQPSLDLRADGSSIGRSDVSARIDVRTRRTFTNDDDSTGRTRVHRAEMRWVPAESGWSLAAGRQQVSAVATIGTFDGVGVRYGGSRWAGGLLSGTQPDATSYGFSTDVREHGVWVERGSRGGGGAGSWRTAVAFIGSYRNGTVDREYAALQERWNRGRLSTTARQEFDLNRDWRAEEEPRVNLTGSFWNARFAWTPTVSVDGGFDTRRRVRLYRDHVTPETEFDDSFRRGYWAGVAVRPWRRARMGFSARRSTGSAAGSANSATARFRWDLPRFFGAGLSTRHTAYDNDRVLGILHSLTVGFDAGSRLHLDTTWGTRDETQQDDATSAHDLRWWSVEAQAALSRGWYVVTSVENNDSDLDQDTLYFLSAVHRFR